MSDNQNIISNLMLRINHQQIWDHPFMCDVQLVKPFNQVNSVYSIYHIYLMNNVKGNILSSLTNSSLVSIGKFCDDGCTYVFKENKFTIKLNNQILIQGPRDRRNGLWKTPLTSYPVASPMTPQE